MDTRISTRSRTEWVQVASGLRPEGRALINGQLVAARSGRTFEDVSPIDGRIIAQVARCETADVESAVTAARAAFERGVWRRTEPKERKRVLLRFAELMRADLERLAALETLDVGKPIGNSLAVDVPFAADCVAYYAEFADKLYDEIAPTGPDDLALIRREPLGVVAAIVPWNYPLIISAWKLAPALLAGNSVVLKPAEQSPLTAIRLGELALSRYNTKRLLARGAIEVGADHYPLVVAVHAAWLGTLWIWGRHQDVDLTALVLFIALQGLRLWILATLGARWTTRVIVVPDEPLVASGPYKYFSHPNYAVVVAEIALLPLALHLALLALIFSGLNAAVLAVRIRSEARALSAIGGPLPRTAS